MHVFKRFLRYYKPYRTVFWLDMACAMLVSVIDLVFPQLLNYLTRNVFTRSPQEVLSLLAPLAFGLLAMYLARYGGRFYITYQGHVMGARMESDMRQDLFDQFQRLSFSYYDHNNTGEMMSKLVSDLFDISELAHHGPENIFISLLKIFGSFVLLLWINVPMTLILLAVTLVMLAFSVWQNGKMRAVFMDNRRKIAGVNASLQDSLAGIRVVKSFANEDVERKKFSGSNLQFLDSKERNYKRMASSTRATTFSRACSSSRCSSRAATSSRTGRLTPWTWQRMRFISTSSSTRLRCWWSSPRCSRKAFPASSAFWK